MAIEGSPLADYIRISKYALHIDGRRETWPEQVARMFGMHEQHYGAKIDSVRDHVNHAREAMLSKRALGSQRVLQFGGEPVLRKNARVYNCTVSHCNRPRFFQEAFHLLLMGCGVGFSVQKHHVARLPNVIRPNAPSPTKSAVTYQIPDSAEGWADALGVLLSSYFVDDQPFPEFAGQIVEFDASLIRPKGARVSSGFKAPGPVPLLRALEMARIILDRVAGEFGALRPIDAFDITMHAADAVLSGGARRSATIAIFSPDDADMVNAKATPRWWDHEPQRQRANISAVLLRETTSFDVFQGLVERTKQWGEPGFYWTDDVEQIPNPCVEIGMWPVLEVPTIKRSALLPGSWSGVEFKSNGRGGGKVQLPGWQMCNLSTMNGGLCDTPAAFFDACRAAATLGTLQAGYTTFEYLGWVSEQIVRAEALLGVSMTGMMDNPDVLFDPDTLEAGAAIVGAVNEEVAEAIGISPAARTTCVKPEGKSSLMLDTLAAGIHPWPGKRGIRHVRASVMETPFQHFKEHNPHAVFLLAETDPNRDNTEVIAFPFEAPEGALTKADVSAIDLLERVILVRKHWVEPGTYPDRCVRPWLRHNVSNTIHVEPDEWADVTEFVFEHRAHFAGVAMLPAAGDKFYDLAPNVTVHTPDEQRSIYGDRAVEMAIALVASLPGSFGGLWPAVSAAISNGQHRFFDGTEAEAAWMEAFEQFASVHFDSDLRAAEVCVKERECWERYLFLRDAYKPVDWADMVEANDDVDFVANAGGCDGVKCEIDFSTMPGAGAK